MKVIYDKIFLKHNNDSHIENKNRLSLFLSELTEKEIIKPKNGEQYLSLCHSEEYVDYIKNLKGKGMLTLERC